MSDYTTRTDCRLCSGPIREVLRLPDTPLANELPAAPIEGGQNKFPLWLAQCESCGHVQLPVIVDPKRLFPPDYPYQSGTSPVFREHLKEFAATVSGMIPKGGRVLEIASNDGTLLREFESLGHETMGIDPAAPYEPGRAVIPQFFTHRLAGMIGKGKYSRDACGPEFKAIVALNVFAHVDDLNDFTAGVAELLAPDGVFVFEVGYLPDVLRNGLLGCVYHEHVSYHHLAPLNGFFERHELHIFEAYRVDSQGGSLRCFVGREGRADKWPPSPSYAELAFSEDLLVRSAGMLLRSHIIVKQRTVLDRVRAMRESGKRVAAFGAPAKLTTWAYALGLGPDDISCVYDDNPLKVGRFTPGNFWPIVPSAQLLIDQPDAVVLFSSNFEAEIRERFKDYKGEWIVV